MRQRAESEWERDWLLYQAHRCIKGHDPVGTRNAYPMIDVYIWQCLIKIQAHPETLQIYPFSATLSELIPEPEHIPSRLELSPPAQYTPSTHHPVRQTHALSLARISPDILTKSHTRSRSKRPPGARLQTRQAHPSQPQSTTALPCSQL